jgi:hypothetical protein
MNRPSPAAAAACVLLLAACGGERGADRDAFTVRDSAGIQIAENGAPAWRDGDAWRLSDEPALEVGMVDGPAEYVLGNVAGVLGTGDGGVLVADGQAKNLRWYDAAGRHVRTVGREGGGPGEFRRIDRVVRFRGDTVSVTDFGNLRTSLMAPDGSTAGEEPIGRGDSGFGRPAGYAADGSLLIRMGRTLGEVPDGLVRDTTRVGRRIPGNAEATVVAHLAGGESVFSDAGHGGFNVQPRAFGLCGCLAVARDGFLYGTGESAEVVRYGLDGARTLFIRWNAGRRPVSAADVSAFRSRQLANAQDRAWTESLLTQMPYPEEMPVYGEIATDSEDNLWVRRFDPDPDTESEWWVFASEGRLLGTVRTPAGLAVQEIGADYVVGVWRDDLGVQHVRRYALHKPQG